MSSRDLAEHPYRYAILLATRGRPWNLARLHSAIVDTAERPDLVDIWCYVDDDDPEGIDAYKATEVPAVFITGPRIRLAASWNDLARRVTDNGDVYGPPYTHLLAWGDDVMPETPGWDRLFAEASWRTGPGFYYGRDGVWDGKRWEQHPEHLVLPTATAITVDAYRTLGWIAPPGLVHLCIDLCWRDVGAASSTLHFVEDIMVRHLHRCVGFADDQTYRDANDDQQQKNADARAHKEYVWSPRFQRDVQKLATLQETWRRERVADVQH